MKPAAIAPALGLALLAACQSSPSVSRSIAVRTVLTGTRCGDVQPGLRLLTEPQAQQTWKRLGHTEVLPVQWGRERVFALSMGQRSSSGYGVQLNVSTAQLQGDTVMVPVTRLRPAPNAITAQVMTTPCVWIVLPKTGYRKVRAVGSDGESFAVTAVED